MFRRIRETQGGGRSAKPQENVQPEEMRPAAVPEQPTADAQVPTAPRATNVEELIATRTQPVRSGNMSEDALNDARRRKRLLDLRVHLHTKLLDTLNLSVIERVSESELRQEIHDIVREELVETDLVLNRIELEKLVKDLVHEVTGLGPLEPLIADESVTDILVNTYNQCYVERGGKLELSDTQFKDNAHLMRVINKIVAAVGRRVDESQPW
ncbi:MAG: ATPase, T2SS/T4P/T4SS family, partial [Pseudomonadota bacterium]